VIWLTWRQYRMPGLVATVAVAFVTLALLYVALRARQIAGAIEVGVDDPLVLGQIQGELGLTDLPYRVIGITVMFLPAFIGLFGGVALLAREFEERTHRLVWTQGISRERWLLSKTALTGGALVVAAVVLAIASGLAGTVLLRLVPPLVPTAGRFANFDIDVPVMIGWALLALCLGIAWSALFKRVLPALFTTFLSFVALRTYVVAQLRPRYLPPEVHPLGQETPLPADAWLLPVHFLDASGQDVAPGRVSALMSEFHAHIEAYGGNLDRYLRDNGVFQPWYFQPAERYWIFQTIELVLLLGASTVCFLIGLWLVRRVRA
jgi:hypothetical protein